MRIWDNLGTKARQNGKFQELNLKRGKINGVLSVCANMKVALFQLLFFLKKKKQIDEKYKTNNKYQIEKKKLPFPQ